jgi:hypothetical protein
MISKISALRTCLVRRDIQTGLEASTRGDKTISLEQVPDDDPKKPDKL